MRKKKPQPDIDDAVISVIKSVGLIGPDGTPKVVQPQAPQPPHIASGKSGGLYGPNWQPYSASAFGGGGTADSGKALDAFLSDASKVPIFNVPGARSAPAKARVSYGPVDQNKMRMAAGGGGSFGGNVTGLGRGTPDFAGTYSDSLMSTYIDPFMSNNFSMFNFSMSRTNPYMTNRMYGSGMYGDIPVYFLMMQEQNGGLLYWPVNIREKLSWFRYFARTDPYVGAAVDLHTDLPMSRIGFSMPKLKNDPGQRKAKACLKKTLQWSEHVRLFERLLESMHEWVIVGNVYSFVEWQEEKKWWNRIVILPPEEVSIIRFPFSDFAFATFRPEPLVRLVSSINSFQGEKSSVSPIDRAIYEQLPKDVVESIVKFGAVIMDTNPLTGSFVAHLARKRVPYADVGVSALERVIIPLLQKEHFKYTQLSLASRLMTPRNKICAPGITPDATDFLRSEIDLSMQDPDYHVVTNFDFSWDVLGASDRLIQLQPEYDRITDEILAALGITKELISGEASYGGTRVTLEVLNTRYLLVRDVFTNFVERQLLYPMAVANGWYEIDEDTGEKEYYHPKLTFNRMTLRDNAEAFDTLFQLYQKGSLPVKVLYELFNLDPNEMNDLLVDDLFTPRDSTFNEMLRTAYGKIGEQVVESTNVLDRVTGSLGLKRIDEEGKPTLSPMDDLGSGIFLAPRPSMPTPGVKSAPQEPSANDMLAETPTAPAADEAPAETAPEVAPEVMPEATEPETPTEPEPEPAATPTDKEDEVAAEPGE